MADLIAPPSTQTPLPEPDDPNRWIGEVSRGDLFAMPVLYRVLAAGDGARHRTARA
jgi:hypothetical protein